MRTSCRAGLAVLLALSSLVTAPVVAAGDDDGGGGAPLTGEVLITSEAGDPGTSGLNGTCSPFGTSTFTFRVTGVAIGPYPGTFVEEGTFTLGPVGFPIESFEATFTISSPAGTVEGTKSLAGVLLPGLGVCGEFAFGATQPEAASLQTPVTYEADITTGTGTTHDRGDSFVSYGDTQLRGPAAQGNGFAFDESFTSTDSGGGDDDDGDDGGGDG